MTFWPRIDLGLRDVEREPRTFWLRHVPLVIVVAVVAGLPPVRAVTGITLPLLAAAVAIHLANYLMLLYTPLVERWPTVTYTWSISLNVFLAALLPWFSGDPDSVWWGFFVVYGLYAPLAAPGSIWIGALLGLGPIAVATAWHAEGRVPIGDSLGAVLVVAVTASFAYGLLSYLRLDRDRLQRRANEVLRTVSLERERARIAADLHDTLGSMLTEISLWQEVAIRADTASARDAIARSRQRTHEALMTLRATILTLDGEDDKPIALVDVIAAHAAGLCAAAGIPLHVDVAPAVTLSTGRGRQLGQIVAEATSNAIRHGRPTCLVLAIRETDLIELTLTDDGAGFDPLVRGEGRGLRSMHDRAVSLGGECDVASAPGGGTCVRVRLPATSRPIAAMA